MTQFVAIIAFALLAWFVLRLVISTGKLIFNIFALAILLPLVFFLYSLVR